ncbi:hypothetical protein BASA84_001361 [Batrachochytrium salamandrivorans]|nr:hypothetical protein BASA81_010676 [Batrachochytrium salamandrivorans]KAH9265933.1 hypothetical protein BASA84_001361 [Batrachochytrium salamandrivorans]
MRHAASPQDKGTQPADEKGDPAPPRQADSTSAIYPELALVVGLLPLLLLYELPLPSLLLLLLPVLLDPKLFATALVPSPDGSVFDARGHLVMRWLCWSESTSSDRSEPSANKMINLKKGLISGLVPLREIASLRPLLVLMLMLLSLVLLRPRLLYLS